MSTAIAASSAPTRNEGEFHRLSQAWQRDTDVRRGMQFVQYLANFLRSLTSDNTRRTYITSLLTFWQWFEATYGRLPTPDRVERQHALRYAEWLRTASYGLDEHRLRSDPARRLEYAIYEILKASPRLHISAIRQRLGRYPELTVYARGERRLTIETEDPDGLDRFLACLVERTKTLVRTPTVDELRRRDPSLYARLGQRIDPEIFVYDRNPHTLAEGVERASSVATRLAALSSFWKYLIHQTGENTGPAGAALLRHNIWEPILADVLVTVAAQRALSRDRKTPDLPLFDRLLATTETRADPASLPAFEDARDRALLLFLRWVAVRARELGSLKRGDIAGDPPILTFVSKGNKRRQIAVPPPAMEALRDLTTKLEALAAAAERAAPSEVPRHARLLADDAPMFPAVARWGCNAGSERALTESGLGRSGIAMMLRRRAIAAGILPGSPDFARIHPHGLRHLAAQEAEGAGVPLNTIQAVLGHKSLATTGVYVEKRDPRKRTLYVPTVAPATAQAPAATPAATPQKPPPRATPARPVVIETTGIPVEERADPIEPGERLVAIEELAPMPAALARARARATEGEAEGPSVGEIEGLTQPVPVADRLAQVYTAAGWGEKGFRQALHKRKMTYADIGASDDLLTTTYAGYTSGLVWWAGPAEKLKPEMPVLAPSQLIDDEGAYGSVRRGLDALWVRWVDNQETDGQGRRVERGPTAAAALVEWLRQALDLMEQTDLARQQRGGAWIPFDASIDLTKTRQGQEVHNFRLQREDKIVLWFSMRAYAYMASRGREGARTGRVVDDVGEDLRPKDPRIAMEWFDAADPVAELPEAERVELFDWLYVLTGRAPVDPTKRYPRAPGGATSALSRRDLAGLLGMICAYDDAEDQRDELLRRKRGGVAVSDGDLRRAERHLAETEKMVDLTAQKLRATPGFSIKGAVKDRAKQTSLAQALSPEAKAKLQAAGSKAPVREMRRAFSMRLLGELFGEAAATDEILRLYALCGRAQPLFQRALPQGGDYADLFRIDHVAKTIVHESDFQRRFAEATGAHSECVARRMARQLWELKKAGVTRFDERAKEIEEQLATWSFYRVPCPAPLRPSSRSASVERHRRGSGRRSTAAARPSASASPRPPSAPRRSSCGGSPPRTRPRCAPAPDRSLPRPSSPRASSSSRIGGASTSAMPGRCSRRPSRCSFGPGSGEDLFAGLRGLFQDRGRAFPPRPETCRVLAAPSPAWALRSGAPKGSRRGSGNGPAGPIHARPDVPTATAMVLGDSAMSRRHLRIYRYDDHGRIVSDGLSSALLPATQVGRTRLQASELVGLGHLLRRRAAYALLYDMLRKHRAAPLFRAVALVACPSRAAAACWSPRARAGMKPKLTPSTTYLGSFAVQVPNATWDTLIVSDVVGVTLATTEKLLQERIREVLGRKVVQIRRKPASDAR